MKKKIFLRSIGILLILYTVWLAQGILRFNPLRQPSPADGLVELRGAYHIHSTFSDGKKSVEEIILTAQRNSLDFIILVDHGRPNTDVLKCQGRYNDLLVLAGSELSVSRGHLVGLGIDDFKGEFSQQAENAAYGIQAASGFSVIAHPYSRVPWSWGENVGYSGLEILSAYSAVEKNLVRALPFLPAFPFRPHYVLLRILDRPDANFRKWDSLAQKAPVYGYFSVDAHMLYRPLLSFLNLVVQLEEAPSKVFPEARAQIFNALRRGRFYNVIHAAAAAGGFRFQGSGKAGRFDMGAQIKWEKGMSLHVQAPFLRTGRVLLLHNGNPIQETREKKMSYSVGDSGVYRVEIYLKGYSPLPKNVPWIVSNPIFIRK